MGFPILVRWYLYIESGPSNLNRVSICHRNASSVKVKVTEHVGTIIMYNSWKRPYLHCIIAYTTMAYKPLSYWIYFMKHKNTFTFCIINQHWNGTDSLYPSSMKTMTCLSRMGQYCCCWWPGDAKSQGISSHGIDWFLLEYSSFSTWRELPIEVPLVSIFKNIIWSSKTFLQRLFVRNLCVCSQHCAS